MLLSKVQQRYCYTQLRNHKEDLAFKPILVGCNLHFTGSLTASYLEMKG